MARMLWEILIILALIALNGFFAMAEMSIVSSRRSRLQQLLEGRSGERAKTALDLADNPNRVLSTVQIGITLIGIGAGAYGGATVADHVGAALDEIPGVAPHGGRIGFALTVASITLLSLIVGELVPKRLALGNAERIAVAVAVPMNFLTKIAGPLVWLLSAASEVALRLIGQSGERDQTVTEDEVKTLIAEGEESGAIDPVERRMIDSVMRLNDRVVRSIMTPRPDVMWIDANDPPDAIAREIRETGYSRLLVCRGEVDEVLGTVSAKAMLNAALEGRPLDPRSIMTDALVVHDGTPVMRLLELFRQASVHMAVVVDEYGSVEGVVTITDVIEAIAGEFPERGRDEEKGITRRDDGSWLVDGMMPIEDVEKALEIEDLREPDADFHTLAGFMLDRLGHLPAVAESVVRGDLRFEVVDMDGRRVDKILIERVDAGDGV